jgi:hypothetical protein
MTTLHKHLCFLLPFSSDLLRSCTLKTSVLWFITHTYENLVTFIYSLFTTNFYLVLWLAFSITCVLVPTLCFWGTLICLIQVLLKEVSFKSRQYQVTGWLVENEIKHITWMNIIMAYIWSLSQHFLWRTKGGHKYLGWSGQLISRHTFYSGPH